MTGSDIYSFDDHERDLVQKSSPAHAKHSPRKSRAEAIPHVPVKSKSKRKLAALDPYIAQETPPERQVGDSALAARQSTISGVAPASNHSPALSRSGREKKLPKRFQPQPREHGRSVNNNGSSARKAVNEDVEMRDAEASSDSEELSEEDDILATPKGPRSTRKVLVGASIEPDDIEAQDSPTKNASIRRIQIQEKQSMSAVKKQLFANASPSVRDAEENFSIATPTKPRMPTLSRAPQQTPSKEQIKTVARRQEVVLPDVNVSEGNVALMKSHVASKLSGRTRLPLAFRDAQYVDVHTLLRETIQRAESNSALILGPRSSGKSLLVNTALQSFSSAGEHFLTVRLDGLIQTDDRMALRAIARQLQPENEEIANADIMTALIAILAHPEEFGESSEPLSTVVILDNFDLFCEHPRQTLLYNLFDIAQSKKAPICVLGLTSRVDAFESMEKRVKSRFSHRVIQLNSLTYEQFVDVAHSAMECTLDFSICEASTTDSADDEAEVARMKAYGEAWNQVIRTAPDLDRLLRSTYLITADLKDLFATLLPVLQQLQSPFLHGLPAPPRISTAGEGKLALLECISLLDLYLLIAACRLELRSWTIGFSSAYDEYRTLANKLTISQRVTGITNARIFGKAVAHASWQRLLRLTLLVRLGGGGGNVLGRRPGGGKDGGEFGAVRCEVALWQVKELVRLGVLKIPAGVHAWLSL